MFKHILIATDGSELAGKAVEHSGLVRTFLQVLIKNSADMLQFGIVAEG